MNSFTKQEVIKLTICSFILSAIIFSVVGYFIGKNSNQAEFYKLKLAQQKQEMLERAKSKAAVDKAFAPLDKSPVIDGDEQGY